jgi:hypothetical protein
MLASESEFCSAFSLPSVVEVSVVVVVGVPWLLSLDEESRGI